MTPDIHEHEFEPQYGLPERLPADERIVWQGSPDFPALACQVFQLRKMAAYFAALMAHGMGSVLWDGGGWMDAARAIKWMAPLSVLGLGSVTMLAWLTARTTVYTLTDKRVVMRLGIVLTVTFNIPLRRVSAAGLKTGRKQVGDITLALSGQDRIAWLHLWPSVRPWRVSQPEPMLRAIVDAPAVAAQLQRAWTAQTGLHSTATQPQPLQQALGPQPVQPGARTSHARLQASPT